MSRTAKLRSRQAHPTTLQVLCLLTNSQMQSFHSHFLYRYCTLSQLIYWRPKFPPRSLHRQLRLITRFCSHIWLQLMAFWWDNSTNLVRISWLCSNRPTNFLVRSMLHILKDMCNSLRLWYSSSLRRSSCLTFEWCSMRLQLDHHHCRGRHC